MITVAEADRLLEGCRRIFPSETVLLREAAGRILREPITADRPYPAVESVRLDGIAIPFSAWENGIREFRIAGMVKAGESRRRVTDTTACLEVMTGAACPDGCDTVIPYEEIELRAGVAVVRNTRPVRRAQHVEPPGHHCAQAQELIASGLRLNAPRIGIAASVGKSEIRVARRPRIAVVATGNELVPTETQPLPHQTRLSSAYGLAAMLGSLSTTWIEHVDDHPDQLTAAFQRGLAAADILLVTGGVSMGKFDFVPEILAQLGVRNLFHRVAQKPGKPLWFGQTPAGQPVFGLPGNPVSSLVCARRYLVPLLLADAGMRTLPTPHFRIAADAPRWEAGVLFLPVSLDVGADGVLAAVPQPTQGSGDFAGLGNSEGFVEISPGNGVLQAGEPVPFYAWEV